MYLTPMNPKRQVFAAPYPVHTTLSKPLVQDDLREGLRVWIEYRGENKIGDSVTLENLRPFGRTWLYMLSDHKTLGYHYYGRSWRCWLKMPTAEERTAAPWEGSYQ